MAKFSLYLDTRTKNERGIYTVKVALRNKGSVFYLPTSVRVERDKWLGDHVAEVTNEDKRINRMLEDRVRLLRVKLMEIEASMNIGAMKAKELMMLIEPGVAEEVREREEKKRLVGFNAFFDRFLERKDKMETRCVYVHTRNKMGVFCDLERLRFEDITYAWLCDFELWMKRRGNKVNTRSIALRCVRAVYNAAINEGVAKLEDYPFRRFKIKKEETEKRSLTVEELRRLRDAKGLTEIQRRFVDAFFLSFYLCGINMVDLKGLLPLEGDGRIRYRRSKTGVLCEVKVPREALRIIERYRGNGRLVNFGEMYKGEGEFLHKMNAALQTVGDVRVVMVRSGNGGWHRKRVFDAWFPRLTSYWARHTWATIAADLDVPDAVIDAALGHRSPYPMTDVYVRRNLKKVDEAVRRVIDYVNEK